MPAENRITREEKKGPVALQIKRLNRANLMNVATALVLSLLARQARSNRTRPLIPDQAAFFLLHRVGAQFLLAKPGRYRDFDFHIVEDGAIIFRGAPRKKLTMLMRRFFRDLASVWATGDALDVAAFALWWISWIHPLEDGNGRTAMAFSYACFCLKLGAVLPGADIMFDSLTSDRDTYLRYLRVSDHGRDTATASGVTDLAPLKAFLDELLLRQMRLSPDFDALAAPT